MSDCPHVYPGRANPCDACVGLEAARAEIVAEKAAHDLTRDALESCIATENAKSAEIAALKEQEALAKLAGKGGAR